MLNGSIFLRHPSDPESLTRLNESKYEAESVLQTLLAKYPELLAGDQMGSSSPRRWLLVTQEMGVPDAEGAADRWSLDHLFLDQDAIPTLIETKRSTDTRIRREVVGQMLDYAANAVVYWPVTKIQTAYEKTCEVMGRDPVQHLELFLAGTKTQDEFWQSVHTNLNAGKIRMVFVADEIPPELQRIIEFLNGQMEPATVLALAVKQYTGQGIQMLVPQVIGATAEAEAKKKVAATSGTPWDEAAFLEALGSAGHPELEAVYRKTLNWTRERQLFEFWGSGVKYGNFIPTLTHRGFRYTCVHLRSTCEIVIAYHHIRSTPGFIDESKRRELAERFNQIAGVSLPLDDVSGWKSFPMHLLTPPEPMTQFLATLDWFFSTVREAIAKDKG